MTTVSVKQALSNTNVGTTVRMRGWVRTFRSNRFIAINDGSTINNIQAVVNFEETNPELLKRITTGACIEVIGDLVPSMGKGQKVEIQVSALTILGDSDADEYPLQPKKHSFEFLREIAHLRPRTNTFGAIFRVRHALAFAIHKYFNDNDFFYLNTPIITGSDAEGAGEMFRVTSLDLANPPKNEDGSINYKEDFFEKETNLTVSGQLEAELGA
jgi:asparaginyl-tRNA synthetase